MKLFNIEEFSSGKFYRKGEKYFSPIKDMFNDISKVTVEDIDDAFVIYASNTLKTTQAVRVSISAINVIEDSIRIYFNPRDNLDFTCEDLQKSTYALLKTKGLLTKDNNNTPLLLLLNEEDMDFINRKLTSNKTSKNINNLEGLDSAFNANDWNKVVSFFGDISELPESNPQVWNDGTIISKLAFAASKVAVLSTIPRDIKKDKNKLTELLSKKKSERALAELLLKRALELDEGNPSYLSSIGYFHYENSIELSAPNGRRDGDLLEEIDKAINYMKMALSINGRRLKEYYRIGYLLVSKKAKNLQFSQKDIINNDIAEIYLEGIEYLSKCIELYDRLDNSKERELKEKQRCFKEYVKSLYNMGKAYEEIFYGYWNEVLFNALTNDQQYITNYELHVSKKHIAYLSNAKEAFEKCWTVECKLDKDILSLSVNEINQSVNNPCVEACDKLYHIGCTYLSIYWSIKDNDNYHDDKRDYYLNGSIDIFKKALQVKIQNNYNLKVKYVSEKLARAYITARKYNDAIEVLKNIKLGPVDYYILNTLALAYYYAKEYDKAIELLKNKYNHKDNKVQLYSKLILLLSYYKNNNKDNVLTLYEELKNNLEGREGKILDLVTSCIDER